SPSCPAHGFVCGSRRVAARRRLVFALSLVHRAARPRPGPSLDRLGALAGNLRLVLCPLGDRRAGCGSSDGIFGGVRSVAAVLSAPFSRGYTRPEGATAPGGRVGAVGILDYPAARRTGRFGGASGVCLLGCSVHGDEIQARAVRTYAKGRVPRDLRR